ncbi:hypothetical protein M3Y98_01184600 [Aphelenchoides besseyi]|nr:hypothetical protein M3Y98_01184600 [Aphelenchoides besseyi]KAI6195237.1 hypothetical protein M3Y96_01209600 [Aphelenchoides besseyi]
MIVESPMPDQYTDFYSKIVQPKFNSNASIFRSTQMPQLYENVPQVSTGNLPFYSINNSILPANNQIATSSSVSTFKPTQWSAFNLANSLKTKWSEAQEIRTKHFVFY